MPLYANQSQTLEDYESTQLVSQDGSIINYDVSDDTYKEASSSDYENYDCLIVADEEPSDQIESSSDFDTSNLTAITLSNGCQAFVSANDLTLDQDSDGEVILDDEEALLVNDCSQQLDGQQIQLGDGRIAILHATTERTEGFQAVELEDGTTAFIALSDLMGEPLDPSSFVICENITNESEIEIDRSAVLENFEAQEIESSKDFPLSQSDDGNAYHSENEDSPNPAYIDVSSFNENVNFDESIDEETIIRVHTHPETEEEGIKTEESTFSDSQNYQALELDNGTICFTVKNDEQKSDSEGNEVNQSGDDFRINGFGVRERAKSITCPEEGCGKCYTTLHHLKVHQRAHTGDRPFPCTIDGCTKAFSTGYGRKAHVRTHTGEKPYKCPEGTCEKSFKTSGDLQKHIRTHTGERPFRCPKPECGRSFTTSNIRKVHFRTHTGERPYLCPESGCGRAFASATNYKNHTRIHSGEKPYICTIEGCSKRFTEYSSLYKHHMVHTQVKPYHCNLCDRHYRQPSTLTMHKRTAHGVVEADDGTEIIMGDTVFAFAEAAAANKRLKTLGANFLSYSKKGNKILTVQASGGGSPDAEGQQYLVLTNSMQIAALEIAYLVSAFLLICVVSTSPLPQSSVHVKFFSPNQNYEHGVHSYSTVGAAGVVPSSPAFTKQFLPRYQPSYLLPQRIQNRGARTLAVHPNQRRVLSNIDSEASSPTGAFLEPSNDIQPLLELDPTYEQPFFSTNKLPEEEVIDPLLLTGDAAREAVKYLFGRGALYWDQIPHARALERNQEERRANGLQINRLSSNRIESQYFRGGRPYREFVKNRQRSYFLY